MSKTQAIKFLLGTLRQSLSESLPIRRKPLVLQLPITSRCNSKCLTCNVWKCSNHVDIDAAKLKAALKDDFFSEVQSAGINGGELTLVPNVDDILLAVLSLPKINTIWVISNCLLPDKLLSLLNRWKSICSDHNVKLGVTFSMDGIGSLDNTIRGRPTAFDNAIKVIETVNQAPGKYCDACDIGCTVSKYNVYNLIEFEEFVKRYSNIQVYYHLAVPNKRIHTFGNPDYSVLSDERATLFAAEFFFRLYTKEHASLARKAQMWANFIYLQDHKHRRLTTCSWSRRDVTIDENLDFYLCATASEKIGNLTEAPASSLIKSKAAKTVLRDVCTHCKTCIHYSYTLSCRGQLAFIWYVASHELFRGRSFRGK